MTDADVIYYRWLDWPTLVMLALLAVGVLVLFIRDLGLSTASVRALGLSTYPRWGLRVGSIAIFCGLCAYIYFDIRVSNHEIKKLVIHKDYLACVSWRERDGNFMRVPWSDFTNISRVYMGRYPEPHLRFDLDGSRAKDRQWTEYVLNQGWVLCSIRGLTDKPRQMAFSTDTDEILSRVVNAWRMAVRPSAAREPGPSNL